MVLKHSRCLGWGGSRLLCRRSDRGEVSAVEVTSGRAAARTAWDAPAQVRVFFWRRH
jgi:hypothetical protein